MKSIFTIHAGEFLVATEIEKKFKDINVWLPSKDTGIDLLLTNKKNQKTTSIQVKFSKDFNSTHVKENMRNNIKATGWWAINKEKIINSTADYWVFVLYNFEEKACDFVIIEPKKLLDIFKKLKRDGKTLHCYLTVTNKKSLFETRGMSKNEIISLSKNESENKNRNLTKYLNNWTLITNRLHKNQALN